MSVITHLRAIAVAAVEPSTLVAFYHETWGLQPLDSSSDPQREISFRANGAEHHVLTLTQGDGHSLDLISLGAASRQDVDQLADTLRRANVAIARGPGPRESLGGGYAVTFRDPEGRLVEVSADVAEAEPIGSPAQGPDRLSHIVLNSVNVRESVEFYTSLLGFEISDWYENDQMVFLRCNSRHHCIVFAPGKWTSLNHVAFEVASADEVMKALGRLRKAGVETIWGPGRHGPGGNVFCYFQDPAGNVIEYTAELLEIDAEWQPHAWERNADNADVWGTSGGITPAVIAAMANPPVGERR